MNDLNFNNEFSYKENKSNLFISFNRAAFIFFIFIIIAFIFSSKIIYLGAQQKDITKKNMSKSDFRSSILDRDGNILAKSVITTNIGINPNLVIDKKKLLINLRLIFPEKNFIEIKNNLDGKKFFYLEKKISQEKYNKIMLLGDKSIINEDKISRIYPQKELYSHLIGQIDDDNNGISGLELSFDYELSTSEKNLNLSLDTDLQYLIREELKKAGEIFKTKGSAAILMNINNGEILSMVSLPDFDLNKRELINDVNFINRATKGVYELGSVFKTFTYAAGLEEKEIKPDTLFKNLEKKIKCAGKTIGEYDDKIPSDLTAEEILIRSGNIGSVRIGQKIGIEKLKNFLEKIGIQSKLKFDIFEVGEPLPFKWGKCKLATVSFGHGITTTPLQLAKAYAIISNGGFDINPTILKKNEIVKSKRILKKGVSNQVNLALRKVVTTAEGTAEFANVPGYEVGGKTGTAQKVLQTGGYSKKKVNTFAAVFPISKPKYVLITLLDETQISSDYVYNYRNKKGSFKGTPFNTAGWTTVEIAGKIIENIGPILATKY
mgnify:CR=1 FL=1